MNKKNIKIDKEETKETRRSEHAINRKEVDGKAISPQEKDRREVHQPRDKA